MTRSKLFDRILTSRLVPDCIGITTTWKLVDGISRYKSTISLLWKGQECHMTLKRFNGDQTNKRVMDHFFMYTRWLKEINDIINDQRKANNLSSYKEFLINQQQPKFYI